MSQREFAIEIIRTLQQAGFEALFAGGCVRDELRGVEPKDYDVATSARPDQVRALFGSRRTIAVGAAFGVIVVLGVHRGQQIEVATFRRDLGYSDGRRPDHVEFTDAEGDARRRDFTINGMFLDPVAERVWDFVGGRRDLDLRIVRAIGNPHERIAEDKLRMLRGIRFTAVLDFMLEPDTAAAIAFHASEIHVVSPERIGAEMRQMLTHQRRHVAARWLRDCHLLPHVVPGGDRLYRNRGSWNARIRWLEQLGMASFEEATALWLGPLLKRDGVGPLVAAWRLSNAEREAIVWLDAHWLTITRASRLPWSQVQPVLAHPFAERAVHLAATVAGDQQLGVAFSRERLGWPPERLDPLPLVTGHDLMQLGVRPGPQLGEWLAAIRAGQLDGALATREDAMEWVRSQKSAEAS